MFLIVIFYRFTHDGVFIQHLFCYSVKQTPKVVNDTWAELVSHGDNVQIKWMLSDNSDMLNFNLL